MTVLHKGAEISDEVTGAGFAIDSLGGAIKEVRGVSIEEDQRHAMLVVLDKMDSTPSRYPRRPGIPAKRPLTGPS